MQNLIFCPESVGDLTSRSFGGDGKNQQVTPQYQINVRCQLFGTAFTLIHELGHTFDYENEYTKSKASRGFEKSWTVISWNDVQDIKPTTEFKERKNICLNNCNGKYLAQTSATSLYDGLYSKGFISQLSSLNAMEDFSYSFAFCYLEISPS